MTEGDVSVNPVGISRMAPLENRTIKIYNDGIQSMTPAADDITFSSSDENVATVNTEGVIHAVAPGEAVITVTKGSKFATVTVAIQ